MDQPCDCGFAVSDRSKTGEERKMKKMTIAIIAVLVTFFATNAMAEIQTHVVVRGDNLWNLSQDELSNCSIDEIIEENSIIKRRNLIKPGWELTCTTDEVAQVTEEVKTKPVEKKEVKEIDHPTLTITKTPNVIEDDKKVQKETKTEVTGHTSVKAEMKKADDTQVKSTVARITKDDNKVQEPYITPSTFSEFVSYGLDHGGLAGIISACVILVLVGIITLLHLLGVIQPMEFLTEVQEWISSMEFNPWYILFGFLILQCIGMEICTFTLESFNPNYILGYIAQVLIVVCLVLLAFLKRYDEYISEWFGNAALKVAGATLMVIAIYALLPHGIHFMNSHPNYLLGFVSPIGAVMVVGACVSFTYSFYQTDIKPYKGHHW